MVDSKDSTTLSSVSRRNLLTGATTAQIFQVIGLPPPSAPDPIVVQWNEWQRLHARATGLCHRWQDIETHLIRKIGVPLVVITSPYNSAVTHAQSHAEIDRALTKLPRSPEVAAALHTDFANQQARWDAEASRLGFDKFKQQEDEAWRQEAEASDAIFSARATNLAGIEIKIALIVELCSTGSDDQEFPWPQLRSTLADVKRLRRNFGVVQC